MQYKMLNQNVKSMLYKLQYICGGKDESTQASIVYNLYLLHEPALIA